MIKVYISSIFIQVPNILTFKYFLYKTWHVTSILWFYFSVEFYQINVEEFLLHTHVHAHIYTHSHFVFLCHNKSTFCSYIMTNLCSILAWIRFVGQGNFGSCEYHPFIYSLNCVNINERDENHNPSCLNTLKVKRNIFKKRTLF